MSEPLEPDYQVYLIRHEHGYVKIGRSSDPEQRYEEIRPYSPYPLELHTTLDAYDEPEARSDNSVENLLHSYYRGFRLKSEWFDLPDDEITGLCELESLYSSDLEVAMWDLQFHPNKSRERNISDDLHMVWSLRSRKDDTAGAIREADR